MLVFAYGLISSLITTLSVRYIARGEALYSAISIFAATLLGVYAVVDIVQSGEGGILYSLGVAVGSYVAVKWDIKGVDKKGCCSNIRPEQCRSKRSLQRILQWLRKQMMDS